VAVARLPGLRSSGVPPGFASWLRFWLRDRRGTAKLGTGGIGGKLLWTNHRADRWPAKRVQSRNKIFATAAK
jgi:hypothetical protein